MWYKFEDILVRILECIAVVLLIVVFMLIVVAIPVGIYDTLNDKKELEESVQFCDHEWELVGHRSYTEAVCKKCFISVDPIILRDYVEATNGLK